MRINIFGDLGTGVTTMGEKLSKVLKVPYYDSDDYFWEKTDPPYIKNKHYENDIHNWAIYVRYTVPCFWNDAFMKTQMMAEMIPSWLPGGGIPSLFHRNHFSCRCHQSYDSKNDKTLRNCPFDNAVDVYYIYSSPNDL